MFVSGSLNQSMTGSSSINDARKGIIGRLGYIFDTKYLFEASFRADASCIFPKNKRWGILSGCICWMAHFRRKLFFKESSSLDFISNLKLRASFAQVGNDKVSAYQWQDSYVLSSVDGPFYNNTAQSLIYYNVFPNLKYHMGNSQQL